MGLKTISVAHGQLPVAKTTLYTCPLGKSALVNARITNVSAAEHRFILYFRHDGSSDSRVLADHSLLPRYSSETDQRITLESGDLIEAQSSDGGSIFDYKLDIMEEEVTE